MHAAVYNAVVGIEGRYEPYRFYAHAPRHASSEAAAVAAAYTGPRGTTPRRRRRASTASTTKSLATIPRRQGQDRTVSRSASSRPRSDRPARRDGRTTLASVRPKPAAPACGVPRRTRAPGPFSAPWLGYVKPLLMRSGDQFDPGRRPPAPRTVYEGLQRGEGYGWARPTRRTGRPRRPRPRASTPATRPSSSTLGLVDQAESADLDIVESARLFAAVRHDAWPMRSIAIWWTRSTTTASGGRSPRSGSPTPTATRHDRPGVDPTWTLADPVTPPYPDYVSGYNGVMGAYSQALEEALKTEQLDLTLTSSDVARADRVTRGATTPATRFARR